MEDIKKHNVRSFTLTQKTPQAFCRQDYWLISNNFFDFVKTTDALLAIRTDHDAIYLEIDELGNDL